MNGVFVYVLFAIGALIFGGAGFLLQTAFRNAKKPFVKLIPSICLLAVLIFMIVKPVFFFYYVALGFLFVGAAVCIVLDFLKKKKK